MPPNKKQRRGCYQATRSQRNLQQRRQQQLREKIDRIIFDDSKETITLGQFHECRLPSILEEIEYFQQRIQNGDINHVKEIEIPACRFEIESNDCMVKPNDDDDDNNNNNNNNNNIRNEGKDNSGDEDDDDSSINTFEDVDNPDPNARILHNKIPLHGRNMTKIGQAIAMFPNLEKLTIFTIDAIGADVLKPLLKAVAQSSSLRVLRIDPPHMDVMTPRQIHHLSIGIQAFHSLETFSMHDVQSDAISSAIMTVQNLKTLQLADRREDSSFYHRARTLPLPTFRPIFDALSTPHCTLVQVSLRYFYCCEGFGLMLRNALAHHSTLTSLFLGPYNLTEEEWRQAVPFLSTNTKLQHFGLGVYRSDSFSKKVDNNGESSCGIWSVETVEQIAMNDGTSLEELQIIPPEKEIPSALQYIQVADLLTNNITMKEIGLSGNHEIDFKKDEYYRLLEAAKRNYGINNYIDVLVCYEDLDDEDDDNDDDDGEEEEEDGDENFQEGSETKDDDDEDDADDGEEEEDGDDELQEGSETKDDDDDDDDDDTSVDPFQRLQMIGYLNRAGRRYLKDDPTSRKRGVDVLSHILVRNDLDAIFFHLLENPSLCQCRD